MTTGKLTSEKPVQASGWTASWARSRAGSESITVGRAQPRPGPTARPPNTVGGREPMLTSVRDGYVAAIAAYDEAATIFEKVGDVPAKGKAATTLVEQGAASAASAAQAMDAAAGTLAASPSAST